MKILTSEVPFAKISASRERVCENPVMTFSIEKRITTGLFIY